MRLTYVHPQAQDTAHAPAGTQGVILDWDVHNGTDEGAFPDGVYRARFTNNYVRAAIPEINYDGDIATWDPTTFAAFDEEAAEYNSMLARTMP
ncbi:uncharacterized protein N7483_009456 [Penicillium malachiteum]|uniref:uncharacterized protein n=1 Tax=Penicillium malachiteum TaxID=1324776 RepID=UPI002549A048|nr:uncharacterized protein N7483_009456 [Penicillium malachiteum]KAJ5721522.1 hypothetical protein N7483_009456 [Penicillium malachiteum]